MEKEKLLINPQEEVERAYHYDDIGSLFITNDLAKAFHSFYTKANPEQPTNSSWYHSCLLAVVFFAGITQGKREERAKRKTTATNNSR